MPIGGFVVTTTKPEDVTALIEALQGVVGVEVHGHDERGNIVTVIEARDSKEMDKLVKKIQQRTDVLSINLSYLNIEDEVDRLAAGEAVPGIFRGRQGSGLPLS